MPAPVSAPTGTLAPWWIDPAACQVDLDAFARLLSENPELSERDDILPFFKAHPHLAALLGSYNLAATTFDRLAVEVRLSNAFVADVVAGDWSRRAYSFVEFEDGKPDSIFTTSGRSVTKWAARFKDGLSQIVDWLWLLDDLEQTLPFEEQFGRRPISITALLVLGRDSGVSTMDRRRLEWHRAHVLVNSHHIYCYTFDDLLRDMRHRLRNFQVWAETSPE